MLSPWLLFLSFLGLFSLFKNSISLLTWIYTFFFRQQKDLKTYGSWAVITGSTDGIGKAFAIKLAENGLNLVLVSRDSVKLKRVSGEIQKKHPMIKIRIFELDFAAENVVAKVAVLGEAIKDLDIGILINNVGVTYPCSMYFHRVDEKIWMKLVRVNVIGTSHVTKVVVNGMVERRRGAIVNIGSGAGAAVPSHPLYAIYAATKAYVDQLSRSLYVEYKSYGIHVQCQVPLYVSTKMASKVAVKQNPSLFVPTAEDYVDAAVQFIGREPRCSPYWSHAAQWLVASLMPDAILDTWRLSIGLKRMKMKMKN